MTQIKAVLFDHDGTLADSEVVHFQFWQKVLLRFDVDFQEVDYQQHFVGVSEYNTAVEIQRRFGLSASVENLVAAKRAEAKAFHASSHYPLMPGVLEVLQALKALHIRMAVVSGSARFVLEANLEGLGLAHYFDYVASGEEVPKNKPAPDVYLLAMEKLGLKPHQCVAVEDTASGLKAASAAGIVTCVIPNAYSAHHDFSGASEVLKDMAEFMPWFNRFGR